MSCNNEISERREIVEVRVCGLSPYGLREACTALANTYGGTMVVDADRGIRSADDAERTVRWIRSVLADPDRMSFNPVPGDGIRIVPRDGRFVIEVDVERADRRHRPVFSEGNEDNVFARFRGRNIRCHPSCIRMMREDAMEAASDVSPLEGTSLSDIDPGSLRAFRRELEDTDPGNRLNVLDDHDFLVGIGAVDGVTGMLTGAGLLMLGQGCAIYAYFPRFALVYREGSENRRIYSCKLDLCCGAFPDNVFGFFSAVRDRIRSYTGDDGVRAALVECLVNALGHAFHMGDPGVMVERFQDRFVFSNPGLFRISPDAAVEGGISDPRNAGIMRMFSLIGVAGCRGDGLRTVCDTWYGRFGLHPVVTEDTERGRVSVVLPFGEPYDASCAEPVVSLRALAGTVENLSIRSQMETFCRILSGCIGRSRYISGLPGLVPDADSDEVFLEWILDGMRMGFLFCGDPSESGWVMVVNTPGLRDHRSRFGRDMEASVRDVIGCLPVSFNPCSR